MQKFSVLCHCRFTHLNHYVGFLETHYIKVNQGKCIPYRSNVSREGKEKGKIIKGELFSAFRRTNHRCSYKNVLISKISLVPHVLLCRSVLLPQSFLLNSTPLLRQQEKHLVRQVVAAAAFHFSPDNLWSCKCVVLGAGLCNLIRAYSVK